MTPPRGICMFCSLPVGDKDEAAFPVRGWELERSQGGANMIFGREREPDVIAHKRCAVRHVKGTEDQTSLFGSPN
jgi:hypothetical protein